MKNLDQMVWDSGLSMSDQMAQRSALTDIDREMCIKQCGLMMEQAIALGRRELAQYWMEQETRAISRRSPEQQARMIAEIDRRISGSVDYFSVQGTADD